MHGVRRQKRRYPLPPAGLADSGVALVTADAVASLSNEGPALMHDIPVVAGDADWRAQPGCREFQKDNPDLVGLLIVTCSGCLSGQVSQGSSSSLAVTENRVADVAETRGASPG